MLGKTVTELNMSWREFQYWQAFLRLEPPDAGARRLTASVLATITNMAGRSLPDKKTVTAEDFLEPPKSQTMEDQIAFMKSLSTGKN